jgi:hypothetical protein
MNDKQAARLVELRQMRQASESVAGKHADRRTAGSSGGRLAGLHLKRFDEFTVLVRGAYLWGDGHRMVDGWNGKKRLDVGDLILFEGRAPRLDGPDVAVFAYEDEDTGKRTLGYFAPDGKGTPGSPDPRALKPFNTSRLAELRQKRLAAESVAEALAKKLGQISGVKRAVVTDTSRPSGDTVDASFELALEGEEKSVQTSRNGAYSKKFVSFKAPLRQLRAAIAKACKASDAYSVKQYAPVRKSEPKDKDGTPPLKYYDSGVWKVSCFIPGSDGKKASDRLAELRQAAFVNQNGIRVPDLPRGWDYTPDGGVFKKVRSKGRLLGVISLGAPPIRGIPDVPNADPYNSTIRWRPKKGEPLVIARYAPGVDVDRLIQSAERWERENPMDKQAARLAELRQQRQAKKLNVGFPKEFLVQLDQGLKDNRQMINSGKLSPQEAKEIKSLIKYQEKTRKQLLREHPEVGKKASGPKLDKDQLAEVKGEMISNGVPVRFMSGGASLDIVTGETVKKGVNVMHQIVYWNFSKATANKIAKWLGVKTAFSG